MALPTARLVGRALRCAPLSRPQRAEDYAPWGSGSLPFRGYFIAIHPEDSSVRNGHTLDGTPSDIRERAEDRRR